VGDPPRLARQRGIDKNKDIGALKCLLDTILRALTDLYLDQIPEDVTLMQGIEAGANPRDQLLAVLPAMAEEKSKAVLAVGGLHLPERLAGESAGDRLYLLAGELA
jgi:hypothetical protein